MKTLDEDLKDKIIIRGGLKLLYADDAIKFIKKCKSQNIMILGFDTFRIIEGDLTQPLLEYSIDYSSSSSNVSKSDVWDNACRYIETIKDKNFLFEIILE